MALQYRKTRVFAACDEKHPVRLFDCFLREIEVRLIGDDYGEIELKLLLLKPMRDLGRVERQGARHAGAEAFGGPKP